MSVQKVPEIANARKATKLKLTISTMCAVMFALFAGAAMAQTAPAPAPGTQKPTPPAPTAPAPAAPAAQAPAAPAGPPKPFPEGAKIAYVSVQAIASNSVEGKAATSKLNDYQKKKAGELGEKNKALQAAQTKLQQGGSVLNDQARSQLEKEIEKMNRDIQFFQQDAQTEGQELLVLDTTGKKAANPPILLEFHARLLRLALCSRRDPIPWADLVPTAGTQGRGWPG